MFDVAVIVKMPPPEDESSLREKWLPRCSDFASRTAEIADRLAENLESQTRLEVRRGGVGPMGYSSPEWPDAVPHPLGLPPIDVGQAIYLRDALLSLAALATITKHTYDLVKELREGHADTRRDDAPRIVLEIHIRNGDVIDTSTTAPAEAEQRLAAAADDWEADLRDEEQRVRERVDTAHVVDFVRLREEAQQKVGSLVWDIWYRENTPLEARIQALRHLFESFHAIEIAIASAERGGGESP